MFDSIRYITRAEIDNLKWNDCISRADNGLIYAYSGYLDRMATNWDALVAGDYQYVMPLPWRKKMGINYLYKPAFTASLGIFGKDLTKEITNKFINSIPEKFKLVHIDLNHSNEADSSVGKITPRVNYTLALHNTYFDLSNNFRENLKRNIKKAIQLNLQYRKDIPLEDIIAISKSQLQKNAPITDRDYNNFIDLFLFLRDQKKAITRAICTDKGEVLASCVFFFSNNRAYYILVGNQPNGKTLGASHYLIDRFIHEHAGTDLVLDFEGSDISSLAFFYSSFGATPEVYPELVINRLPWWGRWKYRM